MALDITLILILCEGWGDMKLGSPQASSPGYFGGGAGKWTIACNYISGIWFLPPIPLWLPIDWAVRSLPISMKAETSVKYVNKHIEKHVPKVMMSLLVSSPPISISHQLFQCGYSNSRDVVASSPCPCPLTSLAKCAAGTEDYTHTRSVKTSK